MTRKQHAAPPTDAALPNDEAMAALDAQFAALVGQRDAQAAALQRRAQAAARALDGWGAVRSAADWAGVSATAAADYASGGFLLTRLGAQRHLEPELMAVLLELRAGLIAQFDARGAAELMLVDLAVLSYANALRVQGWVGDAALLFEHELFGQQGPTATLAGRLGAGRVTGLAAEA